MKKTDYEHGIDKASFALMGMRLEKKKAVKVLPLPTKQRKEKNYRMAVDEVANPTSRRSTNHPCFVYFLRQFL